METVVRRKTKLPDSTRPGQFKFSGFSKNENQEVGISVPPQPDGS
jgi:hypothetical protein